MAACPTPVSLESSAPASLTAPGSAESARVATLEMESSAKMSMRSFSFFEKTFSNSQCDFSQFQLQNANFPLNSARKSRTPASSSTAFTAARTPSLATTVCPVPLATQAPSRMEGAWSRLLPKNRHVHLSREERKPGCSGRER